MSEQNIDEMSLEKALLIVQETINDPKKTKEGYGYVYAPLDEYIDEVRKLLASLGIRLSQREIIHASGAPILQTTLSKNGASIVNEAYLIKTDDAQDYGSFLTYTRRYSLNTVLNIVPKSDDDDGARLKNKPKPKAQPAPKQEPKQTPKEQPRMTLEEEINGKDPKPKVDTPVNISMKEIKELTDLATTKNINHLKLLEFANKSFAKNKLTDLTLSEFNFMKGKLEAIGTEKGNA